MLNLYEDGNIYEFNYFLRPILENVIGPAIEDIRNSFEERKVTISQVIQEEDTVVAFWSLTGNQVGELYGIPGMGKKITLNGSSLFNFKGNEIIRMESLLDAFSMLQQIGRVIVDLDQEELFKSYIKTLIDLNLVPEKFK